MDRSDIKTEQSEQMSQMSDVSEDRGTGYFGSNLYYNPCTEEMLLESGIPESQSKLFI